ncbi:carbohydrate binding domain-containing protein [Paenibacillus hodogayensis]|uniref:Carbohydrate binding domain-containing protein n=1 Tax=Paenibacillus hodogayensis TaxID=279208 RepID=A0ABV5W7X8_9BACL
MIQKKHAFAMLLVCLLLLQTVSAVYPKRALADPPPAGNLLVNPGFEQLVGGLPDVWYIPVAQRATTKAAAAAAYSGSYGISIEAATSANPWIMQKVQVQEGAAYEVAAMFKAVGAVTGQVGMKIEYYADIDGKTSLGGYPFKAPAAHLDGQWHIYAAETEAPAGARYMFAYYRLYGTGTVYLDDASVVKKRDKPELTLKPDRLNYYSEQTAGHALLELLPDDGLFAGRTVDVRITDAAGGAPVFSRSGLAASAAMDVVFDPSVMTTGRPYRIEAVFKEATGTIRSQKEQTLYRWNRPSAIRADRTLTVNGEPFFPVIAYHAGVDDYPLLNQLGVNTVQGPRTSNAAQLQATLDAAQANGLKAMVVLYFDAADKLGTIQSIVTQFKSHPAVLTWMIMDEPTINGISQDALLDVYRLVRSIDSVHPAYIVESDKAAYGSSAQATDVLTTDVYPYALPAPQIERVGDWIREAYTATGGVQPVWTLLQTYRPLTDQPTVGQVRNMAYQSLLAGAKGIGYYSLHDPNWELRQTDLWPGLTAFSAEMKLISDLTLKGTRADLSIGADTQWGVWHLGAETYAVALNVRKEERTVDIPFAAKGSVVERVYGGAHDRWGTWGNALTARLGPEEAQVFRITSFKAEAGRAVAENAAAAGLLSAADWQTLTGSLGARLQTLVQKLDAAQPVEQAATDDAVAAVTQLAQMQAWLDSQTDAALGGKRAQLKQAVERIGGIVAPIAGSTILLEAWTTPGQVASGDSWLLHVRVSNAGSKMVQNARLDLRLPAAFQQPDVQRTIGTLTAGTGSSYTETFAVPASVAASVYEIAAELSYSYDGQPLVRSGAARLAVLSPVQAKLSPGSIQAGGTGSYPFTVKLKNVSAHPVTVGLTYSQAGPLGVTLPATVSLAVYEEKTIQGSINVPSSFDEGIYGLTIAVSADGLVRHLLPLPVKIDRNPIVNPSFELLKPGTSQPEGWNLNSNTWDRNVAHSGQASVRMNPDSANANNTILTNSASFVPVVPGKTYALRGWVKNNATAGAVSLGVRQLKAGNGTISYTWQAAGLHTDWEQVELIFTAAPNAVAIGIYGSISQTANDYAWIDDLELHEIQP